MSADLATVDATHEPESGDESAHNARANHTDPQAEMVALDSLLPWERNPRKIDDTSVQRVAASIREFGWGSPILARKSDRRIIAGHVRARAAAYLGLQLVPVRWLELEDRSAAALALADNRLGEIVEWDNAALYDILRNFDFSEIEVIGWAQTDLEQMTKEFTAGVGELPDLKEQPAHVQKTFTLSKRQCALVERALELAKARGATAEDNDNSNGNALAYISEIYCGEFPDGCR